MTAMTNNCEDCGRAITPVVDLCADCLSGDREPTLTDFENGEVRE